jgi:pyridoxal phosphate enzyme (YggS family)
VTTPSGPPGTGAGPAGPADAAGAGAADAAADADEVRRGEIRAGLLAVRTRIAAACQAAGRSSADVTLIAVTKTRPASDIRLLGDLGIFDVGENKAQEAAAKAAECAALGLRPTWHFVGQLQVNKAASVISYADVIHSVDRLRLVSALGSRAAAAGRSVTCLVQASLDDDPGRGGATADQVMAVADAIAAENGLILGGLMAVAPLGVPAAGPFAKLAELSLHVRSVHPGAVMISAGMSGDLEQAIEAGATHVRVGTALLGGRQTFVR